MRCSPKDFADFEKSALWLDIVDELNIWLEEIRDNLENVDISLRKVRELRGSAMALRNVVNILPNLAEIARQAQEDKHD